MKYQYSFRLEGLPKTMNSIGRAHWTVKAKEALYWKQMVHLMTNGKRPEKPLEKAKITYTRVSTRPCDFDGLVSSFKHIQDGLVSSGILINDTLENVVPTYLWLKGKQRAGYVTVVIEELKPESA